MSEQPTPAEELRERADMHEKYVRHPRPFDAAAEMHLHASVGMLLREVAALREARDACVQAVVGEKKSTATPSGGESGAGSGDVVPNLSLRRENAALRGELMAMGTICAKQREVIGFFASVIKSGEPFTAACEQALQDVNAMTPAAVVDLLVEARALFADMDQSFDRVQSEEWNARLEAWRSALKGREAS